MKKLFCIFIADPVSNFDPKVETTSFIAFELQSRGHEIAFVETGDLFLENGNVSGFASFFRIAKKNGKFSYSKPEKEKVDLKKADVLFLRKDPPVDLAFFNHLTLLEKLEEEYSLDSGKNKKILFINSPQSVKKYNEKLYPLSFPGFFAPTLVSSSAKAISEFISRHKKVVLKPLNLFGGQGIVVTSSKDPNRKSLVEILTRDGTEFIISQKFIPDVKKGDKRIMILDGKILGSFLRVASSGDFRNNLASGGKLKKTFLTQPERQIAERIGKDASKKGLYFLGLDFLGSYLTEINITSPMGLNEVNQTENSHSEREFIAWIEKKMGC